MEVWIIEIHPSFGYLTEENLLTQNEYQAKKFSSKREAELWITNGCGGKPIKLNDPIL